MRPHAVSTITLAGGGKISFAYDANGALTTQTQVDAQNNPVAAKSRAQFYTSCGMPMSMAQGSVSAAFYYGPEHQRAKQLSSAQGTTIYVNPGNDGGALLREGHPAVFFRFAAYSASAKLIWSIGFLLPIPQRITTRSVDLFRQSLAAKVEEVGLGHCRFGMAFGIIVHQ